MVWDTTTNPEIIRNCMRFASPDAVWTGLEEYGTWLRENPYSATVDAELEQALFERGNRQIDLALAKNGRTYEGPVLRLYKRALDGSGDEDFDRAIRLACLSNPIALAVLNSKELDTQASGKGELYRVLTKSDDDQISILMKNPGARFLLRSLYAREDVVADIHEITWRRLVQFSWSNPALNWDRTSGSGPDLDAWKLQAALRKFLTIAPATPDWVIPVHQVLLQLDPFRTGTYQSTAEVLAVLERWKGVTVKESFGNGEQTGFFTPLPMAEELRCLIAALYGKVLIEKKLVPVGKPDSEDVALRCAWYGNTSDMSEEEMDAAREKDGTVFTFAALFNDLLLLTVPRRAEIEMGLTRDLSFIHAKRCAQLKDHYHSFDPRPADELLAEAEAEKPPQEQPDPLAPVMTELAEQRALIAGIKRIVIWGLIVVVAALIFSHR